MTATNSNSPNRSRRTRRTARGAARRPSSRVRSASSRSKAKPEARERADERLQKVMAARGVGSRRECEQLILEGRVEVDQQSVTELGTRVDPTRQEIRVDGEVLTRSKGLYFAVHKPPGVVSTARDPHGRPRVIDLVPPSAGRVFNIGRLDLGSEGLILVTNDGELANLLTHPRHGVPKTYQVRVAGTMTAAELAHLRKGIHLAEGFAQVEEIRIKKRFQKSTLLQIVLSEGRNREIRRILARAGHKVVRLVRSAIGPVRLGALPRGACRKLAAAEVDALRNAASQRPA